MKKIVNFFNKTTGLVIAFLLISVAMMAQVAIDSALTTVGEGVDIIKEIRTPQDLLSMAEVLVMLSINLITYLFGRMGWFKGINKITWTVVFIAAVIGAGFIAFGVTDWVGAIKAYALSASAYELLWKYVFGKSKKTETNETT